MMKHAVAVVLLVMVGCGGTGGPDNALDVDAGAGGAAGDDLGGGTGGAGSGGHGDSPDGSVVATPDERKAEPDSKPLSPDAKASTCANYYPTCGKPPLQPPYTFNGQLFEKPCVDGSGNYLFKGASECAICDHYEGGTHVVENCCQGTFQVQPSGYFPACVASCDECLPM